MSALLVVLALAAPKDLTQRQGSGWTGFKAGSWVKIKTTFTREGRVPAVNIVTTRLKKIGDKTLTLATKRQEALGNLGAESTFVVPKTGEGGVGEKETVKPLKPATLTAAGRTFTCAVRQTTVTKKTGKRLIKEWVAADPKLWVKRLDRTYDKAGKVIDALSLLLDSSPLKRAIERKPVTCLRYNTMRQTGNRREEGIAILSRDVPGGTVERSVKLYQAGKLIMTIHVEVVDFLAK